MEAAPAAVSIGAVIGKSLFAFVLMAVVAIGVAYLIRGIVIALDRLQHLTQSPSPAPVQVQVAEAPSPDDETVRHVAAIAAAVYTVIGAHRLVYIGEAQTGTSWRATGRTIHHISHALKRGADD